MSILERIVAEKRRAVDRARTAIPSADLERQAADAPPVRDFRGALAKRGIQLIAEVKKASPSKGVLVEWFDAVAIAKTYEEHGAACVSVLTDEPFFQGHLDHLRAVREAVACPVLRKDFVIDRYQVTEARAAGADAVLLIAECLDDCRLRSLVRAVEELEMTALVELYEPENLDRVVDAGASLIGINNRNLKTFEVDLEHTLRLADKIPEDCLLVSESGIQTRAEVLRLEAAGVAAILVGETLMKSSNVPAAIRTLLGRCLPVD